MALSCICLFSLIHFIAFTTSLALAPISPAQDSSLQQPPDADSIPFLQNATGEQLGRPHILCNGEEYGFGLNLASCVDAVDRIPATTHKLSFGPRLAGRYNVGTPFRKLSSDGLCAIDFEANSENYIDTARGIDMQNAARRLVNTCYNFNNQGGIVRNLGDRQHINIIVRTYFPKVQCTQPSSPFSPKRGECDILVALQLPLTKEKRNFGLAGAPTVTDVLPRTVVDAYSQKCAFTMNTRVPVDQAAWYDIWAAMVAVDAMCVRDNRAGLAYDLGDSHSLFATLRSIQ